MSGFNAFLMPYSFLRRWTYDELIPSLLYFDRVTQQLSARDEFTLGGLGAASAEVERILEDRSTP